MSLQDIRKTAVFKAPIEKVWKAVSTSEGISAWFMPNDLKPEPGYEFTVQSPFGSSHCKVLEVEPPHRLVFAWDRDGWRVTIELQERGEETEFTLIHSGWGDPDEVIAPANEKRSVIRDRMSGGWDMIVNERLRKVVED